MLNCYRCDVWQSLLVAIEHMLSWYNSFSLACVCTYHKEQQVYLKNVSILFYQSPFAEYFT
jgi:hypothetical protein